MAKRRRVENAWGGPNTKDEFEIIDQAGKLKVLVEDPEGSPAIVEEAVGVWHALLWVLGNIDMPPAERLERKCSAGKQKETRRADGKATTSR